MVDMCGMSRLGGYVSEFDEDGWMDGGKVGWGGEVVR